MSAHYHSATPNRDDRTPPPSNRARIIFYSILAGLVFFGPKLHDLLYR